VIGNVQYPSNTKAVKTAFSHPTRKNRSALAVSYRNENACRHQARANQPHLRVIGPRERQERAADEEHQAHQREQRILLLARDERKRQRQRHAFTVTVQIDAVRIAAAQVAPIEHAELGVALVAVDREQTVPALDVAPVAGPAGSTSETNQPALAARTSQPEP
jgi:hypothetical protein